MISYKCSFFFNITNKSSHQNTEKKGETELVETSGEPMDSSLNSRNWAGGLSTEQPFIKLSQEEYGEHHSSIMHCRFRFCSVTFITDVLTSDQLFSSILPFSLGLMVLVVGLLAWM